MNRYLQILGVVACGGLMFVASCSDDDPTEPPPPQPCTNCTVTVVPEIDATIYEDAAGNLANGRGESLLTGTTSGFPIGLPLKRRALVKFPVASAVPAGATIDSVRVFLTATGGTPGGHPRVTTLHRATNSWGEGASDPSNEQAGTQALPDDATWIHRFFDTSSWTTAGGDYIATASASQIVSETSNFRYQWGTTDSLTANVQMWLDNSTSNHGWIILGDEDPTLIDVATLSPDLDNTLYEDAGGAFSNAKGQHIFVGKTNGLGQPPPEIRRAALRFDIAGSGLILEPALIDSVFLSLMVTKSAGQSGPQNIDVRQMLASWGEGTSDALGEEGGGANSTTGDATWVHRFFDTQNWTSPGGDFAGLVSSSATVDAVGTRYEFPSTAEMVSDVQFWLVNPTANHGWILIGNEAMDGSVKRFGSRENPTAANRPRLQVHYTAISSTVKIFGSQQNPATAQRPSLQIFYTAP